MEVVTIGVDVGQKHDPTAVIVAQAEQQRMAGQNDTLFTVRHMERLRLGTSYVDVGMRLVEIARGVLARQKVRSFIIADATGVGTPVTDMLREDLKREKLAVPLTGAWFVHGDRCTGHLGDRELTFGKAYLVSRLQALLQQGLVLLPKDHPEASALARELADYEIRVSEDGQDSYGAFRTGAHDDLVTALGLATLLDPIREINRRRGYGF